MIKMNYVAMILTIFITTCLSYVRSLTNRADDNTTGGYDVIGVMYYNNVTRTSNNESASFDAIPQNSSLETIISNSTDKYINSTRLLENTKESYIRWNTSAEENDVFVNESDQVKNTSYCYNCTTFDPRNPNTSDIMNTSTTEETFKHDNVTLPMFLTGNKRKQKKYSISHQTNRNNVKKLLPEKQRVMLQHHLHLVPMEDTPLDTMMLQGQQYVVSVLLPIGVGMIGAGMIICTVVSVRKVATKRFVHTPLDDDEEAERSTESHISCISTDHTDRVFLLPTEDI